MLTFLMAAGSVLNGLSALRTASVGDTLGFVFYLAFAAMGFLWAAHLVGLFMAPEPFTPFPRVRDEPDPSDSAGA